MAMTLFTRGGFQAFGQPIKVGAMGQVPAPGPKPVLAAAPSPAPSANVPKGFIPKSPGSTGCPICK